jgi:hypothetical protein
MSGSVMFVMGDEEIQRLEDTIESSDLTAPRIGNQKIPASCWISSKGHMRVDVCYTLRDDNIQWALAVALEIIKRFKVSNAGWDSTGFCGTDSFKGVRPFGTYLNTRGLLGLITPKKKIREWQRIYEEAAVKIFS